MLRHVKRYRLFWLGLSILFLTGQPLVSGCATQFSNDTLFVSQLSLLPVSLSLAKDVRFPDPIVVPAGVVQGGKRVRSTIVTPVTQKAFARLVEQLQQLSPGNRSFFRFSGDFSNQGSERVKVSIFLAEGEVVARDGTPRGRLIAEITLPPHRVISVDGLRGFDTPPEEIERNLLDFIMTLRDTEAISACLVAESTQPFDLLATLSLIGMPPIDFT
ncbi:MAG: hypothetical protein D6795_00525 [Deltaproteobacteria bacterium]|nr:MAG: hypothetical protein D6795_00525 [Deltaproteobacteria bacterium]